MKKDGQFSKKSNWWQYATEFVCEMKQEGQFSKNNNVLLYAIQLVCELKRNKRDSFQQKKTQIDDSMLVNSCAYWNETRGVVFKKTTNWPYNMLLNSYAIQETRGAVFKKTTQIYYSMLFN